MINLVLRKYTPRLVIFYFIKKYYQLFAKERKNEVSDKKVLWVLGMFRSGTSMLTQIMTYYNYNIGEDKELIQPIGTLKNLNPNGFYEDFIFADLSRYLLKKLNRKGDDPPSQNEVETLTWDNFNLIDFIRFSFLEMYEDRVLPTNKIHCYFRLINRGIVDYVDSKGDNPMIKIPMLSFFYLLLLEKWPKSKFLVTYRHPSAVLKSSSRLTQNTHYSLYVKYHEFLINLKNYTSEVGYISYDHILIEPEVFMLKLNSFLDQKPFETFKLSDIIDPTLIRNKPDLDPLEEPLQKCYGELCENSINHCLL